MKKGKFNIGDKVVCIDANFDLNNREDQEYAKYFRFPELLEIYTIRWFYDKSVFLEEIVNPKLEYYYYQEPCFYQWRFAKLPDIEEEIHYLKEHNLAPVNV